MAHRFDPEAFAQRQLDAYNARDLERFVQEYTEDVAVYRMPDPNPVIVGRSALAAQTLHELGYARIAHLDGGIKAWVASGRPTDG